MSASNTKMADMRFPGRMHAESRPRARSGLAPARFPARKNTSRTRRIMCLGSCLPGRPQEQRPDSREPGLFLTNVDESGGRSGLEKAHLHAGELDHVIVDQLARLAAD